MLASHNNWHWALNFIEKVGLGPAVDTGGETLFMIMRDSCSNVFMSPVTSYKSVFVLLLPTQGQYEAALEIFDSKVGLDPDSAGSSVCTQRVP